MLANTDIRLVWLFKEDTRQQIIAEGKALQKCERVKTLSVKQFIFHTKYTFYKIIWTVKRLENQSLMSNQVCSQLEVCKKYINN